MGLFHVLGRRISESCPRMQSALKGCFHASAGGACGVPCYSSLLENEKGGGSMRGDRLSEDPRPRLARHALVLCGSRRRGLRTDRTEVVVAP